MIDESTNFKSLMAQGAIIIDVRTPEEFNAGHINGSINIPLNTITNQINNYDKDKLIILCCASGGRSGMATATLKSNGYTAVYNGGGWNSLNSKL